MSESILAEIAEYTRERVARQKLEKPLDCHALLRNARNDEGGNNARNDEGLYPFERAIAAGGISFICEVKKASPSKGIIAEDFPYLQIALDYEKAGAAAISVLTEPKWFLGSADYLREIAAAVHVPVLRKDFIVDEYQIYETKELGAAALLLIVAILTDEELRRFISLADTLGLSALVETRTEAEIERAVAAGARIIGVNNRDLATFDVEMGTAARLRESVPEGALFVAESGVKSAEDVHALAGANPDAILVGEAMMKATDKRAFLQELKSI